MQQASWHKPQPTVLRAATASQQQQLLRMLQHTMSIVRRGRTAFQQLAAAAG
jgi:hypothetical protein